MDIASGTLEEKLNYDDMTNFTIIHSGNKQDLIKNCSHDSRIAFSLSYTRDIFLRFINNEIELISFNHMGVYGKTEKIRLTYMEWAVFMTHLSHTAGNFERIMAGEKIPKIMVKLGGYDSDLFLSYQTPYKCIQFRNWITPPGSGFNGQAKLLPCNGISLRYGEWKLLLNNIATVETLLAIYHDQ